MLTLEFANIISLLVIISGTLYLVQIAGFIRGLSLLRSGNNAALYRVTVIIPARNEEEKIGACLRSLIDQTYPPHLIEIFVIDDRSADKTSEIVRDFSKSCPSVQLICISDRPLSISPKIFAVQHAVAASTGEIILTTDADCTVGRRWIETIIHHYEKNVGIVTGTAVYAMDAKISPRLFGIQFVDFLSHTACAAGAIGLSKINNCNGSNFSFRRQAFEETGGYGSISGLNSGDDSLLAQKIAGAGWDIVFMTDRESFVTTSPVSSWHEFFHQRMRWAAQTPHYHPLTVLYLTASFIFYLLLFFALPYSILFFSKMPVPVFFLLFKIAADLWIMLKFTGMTFTRSAMKYFFHAEIIHIPTILMAVFGGLFGKFQWKGEKMGRKTLI